jgi:predicted SAM-dependent methyltransferase
MTTLPYLNLGCGSRAHPDWINIDIEPAVPGVIRHDLSRGIPLADRSCAAVYHSHLLEHLRRDDALRMMRECFRVLEPGGIVRVATPDLERICATYLERLAAHRAGDASAAHDVEWMRLELMDQMTREQSGGAMSAFLIDPPNPAFVELRVGSEARALQSPPAGSVFARIRRAGLRVALTVSLRRLLAAVRRGAVTLLIGRAGRRAYDIGRFRLGGEVHQWLYDEQSLAALMIEAGFEQPERRAADESAIPRWREFQLDTGPGGEVIKPDSLFMEARRR